MSNNLKITATRAALDVLTTECAHVWRTQDDKNKGLGSWLHKSIVENTTTAENNQEAYGLIVEIPGGVKLWIDRNEAGKIKIYKAEYEPLNGRKSRKVLSFGRPGLSYFVNRLEKINEPTIYQLARVELPSRKTIVVKLLNSDVLLLKSQSNNQEKARELCEKLIKKRPIFGYF